MHNAVAVDTVFTALADPTRRQLLEYLSRTDQASASAIAKQAAFPNPISRQAIAKHLKILEDAGLVFPTRVGKEVCYRTQPQQLAATGRFLQRMAQRWTRARTEQAS